MASLIQLPPIIVRSSNIQKVEDAITNLFKTSCIKKCTFEEQNIALITFLPMQSSICLDFYKQLQLPITILYDGNKFMVESQYYNNI
jgi:hypothetical protein